MRTLKAFVHDTRGATSIEYALVAGFVSIMIVAGATAIGLKLNNMIKPVATGLS